ncbi:phage DNA ejection protein [Erwinia mallotivora]|uniref:phage DNA ejection protein n=1 Tax=Erwinia mallotivora TaxID=69222 RepID=UPI0035ED9D1C
MVPDFRGEALQETENQLGQARLAGLNLQRQQQQANAQEQKQFREDWQAAYSSGDPSAMEAIIAKYPGQMAMVQQEMGIRDDNHRMALGNAARDLRIAATSGDPAALAQAAMKHKSTLASVGSTPEQLWQQYQQNPKGTQQLIDEVGMSALGVKDYYAEQGNRAERQLRRDQVADASARGWAGLNQAAQFHADDMQMKKLDLSIGGAAVATGGIGGLVAAGGKFLASQLLEKAIEKRSVKFIVKKVIQEGGNALKAGGSKAALNAAEKRLFRDPKILAILNKEFSPEEARSIRRMGVVAAVSGYDASQI